MLIAVQVANALLPVLAKDYPLLLIVLAVPNKNLLLTVNSLPLGLWGIVGFCRLLLPDPFFFALGWHYGDNAITWMERRTPTFGQMMRELERLFAKAGWLLVLIMPNNYVCLIAGASGMRRRWFWALNVVGTIGRLIVLWRVGAALEDLINRVLAFLSEYRLPLLAVSVGLVAFTGLREWRAGSSEIQSLLELEHELEQDIDEELEQKLAEALDQDVEQALEHELGHELEQDDPTPPGR
jgi:membrane protein DedA with SNARE-associated domain